MKCYASFRNMLVSVLLAVSLFPAAALAGGTNFDMKVHYCGFQGTISDHAEVPGANNTLLAWAHSFKIRIAFYNGGDTVQWVAKTIKYDVALGDTVTVECPEKGCRLKPYIFLSSSNDPIWTGTYSPDHSFDDGDATGAMKEHEYALYLVSSGGGSNGRFTHKFKMYSNQNCSAQQKRTTGRHWYLGGNYRETYYPHSVGRSTGINPGPLYAGSNSWRITFPNTLFVTPSDTLHDDFYDSSQSGSPLTLDGVDQYATIPDHEDIDFGPDDDFTVAVWIKPNTTQLHTSSPNSVVEKWHTTSEGYPYVIRYHSDSGKIQGARYDGNKNPSIISDVSINDGQFHHVTFIKKSDTLKLYVDGVISGETTDTTTGTTTNTAPVYLGIRNGGKPFKGSIHDLRIYSYAITTQELAVLNN